jgi:hypothetical protein
VVVDLESKVMDLVVGEMDQESMVDLVVEEG